MAQANRHLVVEFDQDHRAVDAVVEDRALRVADPREVRALEMAAHFVHSHAGVTLAHVGHEEPDEIDELPPLCLVEGGRSNAGVVEDLVVFEGFADVVVAGLAH